MNTFQAQVTENIAPNRLLSLTGGNGLPQVSITEPEGNPDFRSTGELEADTEITVTLRNAPVWEVEAGENLSAGTYVEVGEEGIIVASEGNGIGYVAEEVAEGEVAKLVRQSGGASEQGPPGPKGDKGDKGNKGDKGDKGDPGENAEPQFTEEQVTQLLALLEG